MQFVILNLAILSRNYFCAAKAIGSGAQSHEMRASSFPFSLFALI